MVVEFAKQWGYEKMTAISIKKQLSVNFIIKDKSEGGYWTETLITPLQKN